MSYIKRINEFLVESKDSDKFSDLCWWLSYAIKKEDDKDIPHICITTEDLIGDFKKTIMDRAIYPDRKYWKEFIDDFDNIKKSNFIILDDNNILYAKKDVYAFKRIEKDDSKTYLLIILKNKTDVKYLYDNEDDFKAIRARSLMLI